MENSTAIVAMVCVTIVALCIILAIMTYKRDRLEVNSKTRYKDFRNEIAITSSNEEDSKN